MAWRASFTVRWAAADGKDGADGRGILSVNVYFAVHTSSTEAPDNFPYDTITNADFKDGYYVWQAQKITYSDGTPSGFVGAVCLGGCNDLASAYEQYSLGSATAAETGTYPWKASPYEGIQGKYVWQRTRLQWKGSDFTYVPSSAGVCVGYLGVDGTSAIHIYTDREVVTHKYGDTTDIAIMVRLMNGETAISTDQYTFSTSGVTIGSTYKGSDFYGLTITPTATTEYDTSLVVTIVYNRVTYTKYIPFDTLKNGDNGTSVTSADVVYYLHYSPTIAPSDDSDWVTTIDLQSMNEHQLSYYLWTATKTFYTSGDPTMSGKRCLGQAKDIVAVTEVYAVSADGTNAPADSAFDTTFTKTKGMWLWSASKVVNTSSTPTILNKVCVGYFGEDGDQGDSVRPNLLRNSGRVVVRYNTASGDHYYYFEDMTVYLTKGKTYCISGETNGIFSASHDTTTTSNNVTLWLANKAKTVHKIVSTAAMTADGKTGTAFTWDQNTGTYILRVNFYRPGMFWVRRIKIEEGSTATAWLASVDDPSGINRNLLLGTDFKHSVSAWNILTNTFADNAIDGQRAAYVDNATASYATIASQYLPGKINTSEEYTLSWWSKGYVTVYLIGAVATTTRLVIDGEATSYSYTSPSFNDTEWTYHTITFITMAELEDTACVMFRKPSYDSTDANTQTGYVCMPKLERGYRASAWGAEGIDGQVYRITEWTSGTEYHNDGEDIASPRWIDIVVITDSEGKVTGRWQCLKTHTADSTNKPSTAGNTTYWEVINDMDPIYTPLLVADNAVIRFGQANRLIIMNKENNAIQAGMQGIASTVTDGIILWVGNSTPEDAPFKVTYDGKLYATGAYVEGQIVATSGKFTGEIVATSGTFTGSLRLPWTETGSFVETSDNVIIKHTSTSDIYYYLETDLAQSGRIVRLINNNTTYKGGVQVWTNSGKKYVFYEDGMTYSELRLGAGEMVELIGFCNGSNVYGWIVLSRQYLNETYPMGHGLRCIAMGRVRTNAGTGTATLSSDEYKVANRCSISVSRTSEGMYTLKLQSYLSNALFESEADVMCMLTGFSPSDNTNMLTKASVRSIVLSTDKKTVTINVALSDDASANDGGFEFVIFSMAQWDSLYTF